MYMAERIFPNEIFCLIVEILADDVPSLQNISLVCKELLQLSRPLIFCDIDLAERFLVPLSRVNPFLHLIRDPQSEYLRDYVQRLSINPAMFGRHSAKFNFIFQNLPSLDSLRLMSLDHAVFPIVQAHLTEKLIELRISESIFSDPEYVEPFQHLLTSFTRLRYLALDDLDMVIGHEQEIILPCTLEVLSLSYLETELLRAIALGMKTSWPPSLKSVIITYSSFTKIGRIFWEAINSNTQLVLDIDDVDPFDKPAFPVTVSSRGIMFSCFQSLQALSLICRTISESPDSLQIFCVDFNPDIRFGSIDIGAVETGEQMLDIDTALVKRHGLGTLKRLCFRCTKRDGAYSGADSLQPPIGSREDRTILDHIRVLLPCSVGKGFVEIDTSTRWFEYSF